MKTMSEENSGSHFQLLNEESSITGGKSVSEIVQILRTNANLKLKVRDFDDNEDAEEQPNKTSQIFPWIKKFTAQCRETIPNPDIKKLDELITNFLKHIEDSVKECYKRPKRAHKLKTRMFSFLQVFNMIYGQLKQPLEHASYLDKMSDVMALYIDIELKSSRRGREHPKKISERISSSLFVFLDKSIEHILDTVLKAKFFIKKYSDICCPIMARLLKEKPGAMYETTYVRYLLSFKLWKKLAGKDHYVNINKEAVAKLTPPPDFAEKLKSGLFSNVLPYVSKSEKDRITLFFMQSPFNVKKKAQAFLKDEKKLQPNLDLERSLLFDDDLQITSFFDDDNDELNNQPNVLMNDIWKNLVDREDDCFDNLFIPMDMMDSKEEDENIIVDLKKTKLKEKSKKITKDKATNGLIKTSMKKRKALKASNNNIVKNISNKDVVMDLIRSDLTKPVSSVIPKDEIYVVSCIKAEDPLSSLTNCPEQKQPKPCATVEPEQCKEVTDSLSNVTEVLPIKLIQIPTTTSCPDLVCREALVNLNEEKSNTVETSVPTIITNPDLAIVNPTISDVDSLETTPTTTVDSSGIYEGVKSETLSKDLFDEPSDSTFRIGKPEDARILEENFVAEEVVISSDMEQDSGCTFLFLENDGKIDQTDIMNVIGITRDSTAFCNDEVVVHSELSIKDQEKQQIAISSMLDSQNIALNSSKEAETKEHSSGSPENQFLSSIIASTETNENYVSLYRRQDSYTCNEMFLQRLFSDPASVDADPASVDDGSDDDSRYQNRRRFPSGGKRPACRERMEESKSENDEDFEPLTPSSDSQQPSPMDTSSDMTNLQPATMEFSPPDSDQEIKTPQNPVEDEISSHSEERSEKKYVQQEHGQMKELSVQMSVVDVISANEHILNKEKESPKGMFEPPDHVLHFRTVDFDSKFEHFQSQLCNMYNTVENILDTDPVPYPPNKVIGYPIHGYVRCPCAYCDSNFVTLDKNYNILYQMRSSKILYHVDKKRLLTKILDKKMEDDKLLKSIEDTIPQKSNEDPDLEEKTGSSCNPENRNETRNNSFEETFARNEIADSEPKETENPLTETENKLDPVEGCEKNDSKNEYVSLPPKKRRAFNVELDSNHNSKDKSLKIQHVSNNKKSKVGDEQNVGKHACTSQSQVEKICDEISAEETGKSISSPGESSNRFSPVKIKAVDGSYRVLSETSSTSGKPVEESNVSNENIPKSQRKKCHKKHSRRSKEEKRLRKEQKRLKKLQKLEESKND